MCKKNLQTESLISALQFLQITHFKVLNLAKFCGKKKHVAIGSLWRVPDQTMDKVCIFLMLLKCQQEPGHSHRYYSFTERRSRQRAYTTFSESTVSGCRSFIKLAYGTSQLVHRCITIADVMNCSLRGKYVKIVLARIVINADLPLSKIQRFCHQTSQM